MKEKGPLRYAAAPGQFLLHAALVGFDHLLDHLATHTACLTGGQVAVVTFLQVDADLPWCSTAILNSCNAYSFTAIGSVRSACSEHSSPIKR